TLFDGVGDPTLDCELRRPPAAANGNSTGKPGAAQRERERAADQTAADNADVLESAHIEFICIGCIGYLGRIGQIGQIGFVRAVHSRLSTAGAMTRSCPASLSNCSSVSDCAPSRSAWLGSWWTSMSNPSAPAAIAARAIGGTLSRRPMARLGSTMIGRWENFLITGIAERSSVWRV